MNLLLVLPAILAATQVSDPPPESKGPAPNSPSLYQQTAPPTPLTTELVVSGIAAPVFLTAPAGDTTRLFVLEQYAATIRLVKNGVLLPAPFLDLSAAVLAGGEQGLLGMAFHPQFWSNGFFYVNYTEQPNGDTVVMRYKISDTSPELADPTSGVLIIKIPQPFSNHNGGMIQFGPDGYLYIAMGDGGAAYDPFNNSQNLSSRLGKMLRIDVDGGAPYAIPPSNPFVGVPGVAPEIWHFGLRNPWRFSFDRYTGDMYIGDVGQDSREEVNYQPAGHPGGINYGWRCFEGSSPTGVTGCTTGVPATLPILEYPHALPGCAIVGGFVYRGYSIPDLRGHYFFSEFCKNRIWSFKGAGGTVNDFVERTFELTPNDGVSSIATISSFGEDGVGELYLLDHSGGEIFRVIPKNPVGLQGISYFGTGTPGCAGSEVLTATKSPIVGNPYFGFQCTGAPAFSTGFLLVADAGLPMGGDPLGIGAATYIDVFSSTELIPLSMTSGPFGNGSISVPLPNDPGLVGLSYTGQVFWYWGNGCPQLPIGLSSSSAIIVTVLP